MIFKKKSKQTAMMDDLNKVLKKHKTQAYFVVATVNNKDMGCSIEGKPKNLAAMIASAMDEEEVVYDLVSNAAIAAGAEKLTGLFKEFQLFDRAKGKSKN